MDPNASPSRRLRCARCQRPAATCLCHLAVPVANRTEVLVLQHPMEAGHAKGTVPLLHLSLARSRIEVGERFDPDVLQGWLGDDAVLLYPEEGGPGSTPALLQPGRLVVIDATWRKSRLMLHVNPLLRQLPRLALSAPPASRYGMRRAHRPAQRSTLEATLLALEQLEGASPAHAALLGALDELVRDWSARAGAAD
ncbi:tRNA-uridine aminocarboxypropyltransferase [Rhizobacter sp. LjRoot28]|uniref:tRNA-uridine aminocarboxypropyltransferase n=1 Tax=Rhizobacter sp. LjRoot28 TaxID=3342309 RepID=UPI003ECFDE25